MRVRWKTRQREIQGDRCYLCGQKMLFTFPKPHEVWLFASVDHIIPLSRGGLDVAWNKALAHRRCNEDKADMPLHEYLDARDAKRRPVNPFARQLLSQPQFAPTAAEP